MAVTAYTVVAKKDPAAFAAAVQAAITGGSQPFGSPFHDPNTDCLVQAMVVGGIVVTGATGAAGADGAAGATGATGPASTGYPIVTAVERALLTPTEGDVVFNTTTNKINFYTGAAWEVVTSA